MAVISDLTAWLAETTDHLAVSYIRRMARAEFYGDAGRIATAQANAIGWASR
jgi:hypothetical protein